MPMKVKNLQMLEIISLRDNDIQHIPDELHLLSRLHELHLQVILLHDIAPVTPAN